MGQPSGHKTLLLLPDLAFVKYSSFFWSFNKIVTYLQIGYNRLEIYNKKAYMPILNLNYTRVKADEKKFGSGFSLNSLSRRFRKI